MAFWKSECGRKLWCTNHKNREVLNGGESFRFIRFEIMFPKKTDWCLFKSKLFQILFCRSWNEIATRRKTEISSSSSPNKEAVNPFQITQGNLDFYPKTENFTGCRKLFKKALRYPWLSKVLHRNWKLFLKNRNYKS